MQVCEGYESSGPNFVPTKEELNAAIFRQNTVLNLLKFITEKNLGDFDKNVNIAFINVEPFKTLTQFSETISKLNQSRSFPSEEIGHSLQVIVHKQDDIQSREVCRKSGCGIIASLQTNEAIREKLVTDWIPSLKKVAGFKKAFDHKKKQVSVITLEGKVNTLINIKFKHTVVLFLPYKGKELKPIKK